jgi:hypothetical protein
MLRAENSGSDISMLDELPVICVCMLYHTLKGGSLVEALRSVDQLDYPKERLVLMMIDNYSVDGAFEYVRDWLEARREKYMRVVHIRAKGTSHGLETSVSLRHLTWVSSIFLSLNRM